MREYKKYECVPTFKHHYTCPTCKDPFSTNYVQQVFCMDPCTSQPKKVEKEVVVRKTHAENLARKREIRQEEKEFHELNRKYLSMKL